MLGAWKECKQCQSEERVEKNVPNDYEVYSKYKISAKHIIDKAETCLVEAKNSFYRDNLAR